MDSFNSPNHRENILLENSTTDTLDVQGGENDGCLSQENTDLKGSFIVTSSSDGNLESVNSDFVSEELDKSLTLTMCRPTRRSSDKEAYCDDINRNKKVSCESKQLVKNSDELATIDEEKMPVSCDDVIVSTADQVNVGSRDDTLKTIDTKEIFKPEETSDNCNRINVKSAKPGSKLYDPVVELGKTAGDNELVKRNNTEVSRGPQQGSVSSSPATIGILASPVPTPVENVRGRKHSTGEVVSKNNSPLSVDNSAKGARSGRMSDQTTPIKHKENRLPAIINTDERTSKNKKCKRRNSSCSITNNSNVNMTNKINASVNRPRCHSSHGVRERNTTFQQRNNAIARSYDKSVNILGSQNSLESSEQQRPVSAFEKRYTMRELRRALPRKSFFSCHEKAMKDAGLETDDPDKKRKAERLKARLERIANEFSPLPSSRCNPENDSQGLVNGVVNITINDGDGLVNEIIGSDNGKEEIDTVVSMKHSDVATGSSDAITEVSPSKYETSKLGVKSTYTQKKRPGSARQEHIDCKPLLQYLEYVKDNREEYLHQNNANMSQFKSHPVSRLISLGKAFELRHLGGIPRRHDDDVIVMAAKALRPRTSDSAKYTKIERDKSGTHRGQESLRQARPSSEDKRKQESHAKEEEHAKTELERKRIRAEEWTKSVSTNTLTKAKIQSLRELGADDVEIMKWWDTFKTCRYLRDTGPVEEKVS